MSLHSLWRHLNRSACFRQCFVQSSLRRKDLRFDRVARCREQGQIEAALKDKGMSAQICYRLFMPKWAIGIQLWRTPNRSSQY